MDADATLDALFAPGCAGPERPAGGLERLPGPSPCKVGPAGLYSLASRFRIGVGDLALGGGAPERLRASSSKAAPVRVPSTASRNRANRDKAVRSRNFR
jgi:hypothetical protein